MEILTKKELRWEVKMPVWVNTGCSGSSQHQNLHPMLTTPGPPHLVIQGSWPRCAFEGWVRRVMSVSQRLGLSFHCSSWSVFSEDLHNHLVNEKSKNFIFIYRYDIKMRGQVSVLCFPRKDCRSRRKTGAVCTQGIPEPQPQAGGAWKEEETSRTVTLCPGALGNQIVLSGWRPMCFFCFSHICHGIKIKLKVKRMGFWRNTLQS